MTAESLSAELSEASKSLRRCQCGSAVAMLYEPGCTRIVCHAEDRTVMALPDWQPRELARRWNSTLERR